VTDKTGRRAGAGVRDGDGVINNSSAAKKTLDGPALAHGDCPPRREQSLVMTEEFVPPMASGDGVVDGRRAGEIICRGEK